MCLLREKHEKQSKAGQWLGVLIALQTELVQPRAGWRQPCQNRTGTGSAGKWQCSRLSQEAGSVPGWACGPA